MAKQTNDSCFIGTDFTRAFHIKNAAEDTSLDIGAWTLSWMLKARKTDTDATAKVTKTTSSGIVIAGVFNGTPASNLQRATVTVLDTDIDTLTEGTYYYELKRTNDGAETVLAYGEMRVQRGVHHA